MTDPQRPVTPTVTRLFILDSAHDVEHSLLREWLLKQAIAPGEQVREVVLSIARQQETIDARVLIPHLSSLVDTTLVTPVRVVWSDSRDVARPTPRIRDLLRGNLRLPTESQARKIYANYPERARCIEGSPATFAALRHRLSALEGDPESPAALANFIADQAGLALDIAERQLRGGRYKVPRRVARNMQNSKRYRQALQAVSAETGQSLDALRERSERIFKELIAIPRTFWQDVLAVFNRRIIGMGYQPQFVVDSESLERIRAVVRSKPSVLLWTHKTHIDGFAVYTMLFENDFPVPHVLGGVNMAFAGLGYAARRSGAIFIRRSFQGDPLYKMILRQYIGYLLEKRFPLTWAFEGTRSRVGKLMPPRYGLLKYVVEAAHATDSKDLHIIPVALNYDLIGDVKDYVREQSGAVKQPESLRWFLGYVRGLRRPLGKIYIDFGEPVVLADPPSAEDTLALKKTALQVGVEANRVTPITLSSLVTTILLSVAPRALTRLELGKQMLRYLKWARERGIRVASNFDRGTTADLNALADVLGEYGLVKRFDEGPEVVYALAPEQHAVASYYRNTTIHHFVVKAIAELSLMAVAGMREQRTEAFWSEAARLRDLFKFEFFYAPSDAFNSELDTELSRYDADWRKKLETDADYPSRLLGDLSPLVARATLLPFVEAYQVVANIISRLGASETISAKECLSQSLALGRQAYLQRRISSEASIGKLLFENAYVLAENLKLLDIDDPSVQMRRHKMRKDFLELANRLERIRIMTLPGDNW